LWGKKIKVATDCHYLNKIALTKKMIGENLSRREGIEPLADSQKNLGTEGEKYENIKLKKANSLEEEAGLRNKLR